VIAAYGGVGSNSRDHVDGNKGGHGSDHSGGGDCCGDDLDIN